MANSNSAVPDDTEHWLYRGMQLVMAGIALYGLVKGKPGVIVNGGVAFLLTFLPAYLRRERGVQLGPGITVWITAAVLLHALGAFWLYRTVWWYDQLAHALSASVIAGTGYAVTQAINEYHREVSLPPRFMFLYILIVVMAAGVIWEILEYGIGWMSTRIGSVEVITQYGVNDVIADLMANLVGGIVFGIWGMQRVQYVVTSIRRWLRFTG